jgi:hypothetical protein
VLSANESAGENVGRGGVADEGGPIAGSADGLEKDKNSVGDFSGPIQSTEREDESKHDPEITFAVAETPIGASAAPKATDEVPNTNQDEPESCGRLPSAPPKRGLRRVATSVPDSDVPQASKKAKRAPDWIPQETEALIIRKVEPSLPKGNAVWELISSEISGRSSQQCRQRWDTVKKSWKKIKDYCVAQSKELSQVSEEEFVSMKLDMNFFRNARWYQMIDEYSSRPTITFSGPAANEPNGASTSTHPGGEPNLPGSACPNLEVSRPEFLAAAFSVEHRPAAVDLAVCFPHVFTVCFPIEADARKCKNKVAIRIRIATIVCIDLVLRDLIFSQYGWRTCKWQTSV